MQQQGSEAKTPQKKGAHFFRKSLFWPNFFSKTLILHHPLKTVHQKISKKPYFYRLKKDGQVIDPTMARLLTLKWPKYGQVIDPTAHIYIYGFGAICRRKFCHFYRFFPSFIAKNGQKEMLQICPVSVRSRSIEITQNWLETAVPSPFFQKNDRDCSFRPFYWFILGLNVKIVGLFGPKKALNCRNVKHVKLYLSKKGSKLRRQTAP